MASADAQVGQGLIKEVQSGDCVTILLRGKGPAKELTLTFASLEAPRLSRRNGDAPFAQQAREFLRSRCAGKMVTFKVEYEVASIGRTFGTVILDGEDLSHAVVEAGFAKVKEARGDERSGTYDELVALQEDAVAAGAGIWCKDPKRIEAASIRIRDSGDVSDAELARVFAEINNKPVDAIIEYVRDGSFMRVQLVDFHLVVPFALAGVACPSFRGKGVKLADGSYDDSGAKPEPFAAIAKQFTEARLLSRRVNIRCCAGPKKVRTFFGKVEHPKGDISAAILEAGLGRVSDWTLRYTPNWRALRAAERKAKANKRRIWKSYTPPPAPEQPPFDGRIVEVHSGDTLSVEDTATGEVHRVTLSSIRVPFGGTRDGAKPAEPFSFESRDCLRTLTIGKVARVTPEYTRMGRGDRPRLFAAVVIGNRNVGVELVKRGLATLVRHRDDEPHSAALDDILAAEIAAERSRLGVHGDPKKALPPANDVTRDSQKAKQFMAFLTRPGERIHQGVVDFCFNASRFKVYVPKENVIITVSLIGVATPRTARGPRNGQPAEPAEPCAAEALNFVRSTVLNRNVTIDIEDSDDRGAALATVFVTVNGRRSNLGLELLKRGFGRVVGWSADKSSSRSQLFDTQDLARDQRIGMWENWTPKSRGGGGEAEGDGEDATAMVGEQRIRVSHIDDARTFYITLDNDEGAAELAELQVAGPSLTPPAGGVKRKGIYAIDFNGEWCRVRADAITVTAAAGEEAAAAAAAATAADADGDAAADADADAAAGGDDADAAAASEEAPAAASTPASAQVDISYLDFGNRETVPASVLLELPEGLAKLPPAATKAHLAFIKAPRLEREMGQDAAEFLSQLVWEQDLVAEILPADDNGVPVILFDAASVEQAKGAAAAAKEAAEQKKAAAAAAEAAGEDGGDDDEEDEEEEATPEVAPLVSINAALVKAGLARFRRPRQRRGFGGRPAPKPKAPKGPHAPLQATLAKLEEAAHHNHVGMWRYGDPGDSDDGGSRSPF